MLVSRGARRDLRDREGETAGTLARRAGHAQIEAILRVPVPPHAAAAPPH
jgi:hypothetical protein